jgi:uncharacterized membrane protein YhhN
VISEAGAPGHSRHPVCVPRDRKLPALRAYSMSTPPRTMQLALRVAVSVALLAAAGAAGWSYMHGDQGEAISITCKVVPAVVAAACCWIARMPSSAEPSWLPGRYALAMSVVLLVCGLADALIELAFVAGLAAFLCAHIVFIVAFCPRRVTRVGAQAAMVALPRAATAALAGAYIVIGGAVSGVLFSRSASNTANLQRLPDSPPLLVGVIIYMSALLCVNFCAARLVAAVLVAYRPLQRQEPTGVPGTRICDVEAGDDRGSAPLLTTTGGEPAISSPSWADPACLSAYALLAGTSLFLVSDSSLAFNTFATPLGSSSNFIIMLTYWGALACYALSALLAEWARGRAVPGAVGIVEGAPFSSCCRRQGA